MLITYSVKNFKSIKEDLEFSMLASESIDKAYCTSITLLNGIEIEILNRSLFFGANASGKSNFIHSIKFICDFILTKQQSGFKIPIQQYKTNGSLSDDTRFTFLFVLGGIIYEYGFTLTKEKVVEEWLYTANEFPIEEDGLVPIFERITSEYDQTEIEIYEENSCLSIEEKNLATILKSSIKEKQKNLLFLVKLAENGVSLAEDIIEWFERIVVIHPESLYEHLALDLVLDANFADFSSSLIRKFDTGIKKIISHKAKVSLKQLAERFQVSTEVVSELVQNKSRLLDINGEAYILCSDDQDNPTLIQLLSEHIIDGESHFFSRNEESDGTKRLLDLLPLLYGLDKLTSLIIVDEIDRSFHSLLIREFLNEFMSLSKGTENQLIATAHDTTILDLDYLAREEIWFFEKTEQGITTIKPLLDFRIQKDYDIAMGYFTGRFGAVPNIEKGRDYL